MPGAACKGLDDEIWFGPHICGPACDDVGCMEGKSEEGRFQRIKTAKEICGECPALVACLEWAVASNQDFGVWGMCTERERKRLRTMIRATGFETLADFLKSPYAERAAQELPVINTLIRRTQGAT